MFKRLSISLFLLFFLLSGCATAAATPSRAVKSMPAAAPTSAPAASDLAVESAGIAPGTNTIAGGAPQQEVKRLVIMDASLTVVVVDPVKSLADIQTMTQQMGGYVVSVNSYKVSGDNGVELPEGTVTLRIPAAKLNDAMAKIKSMVRDPQADILSETVSGQDVTKDYVDLSSRLKNLQQMEADLTKIMDAATKTEDVINVYNQISSVREQIEVIQGQMKYYEEASAMSSISVTLRAEAAVQPLSIGGWQPVGVARDAVQALINVLKVIGNALIYIVLFCIPSLLVVGIVVGLPVWLVWHFSQPLRERRKVAREAKSAQQQPPAPPQKTP